MPPSAPPVLEVQGLRTVVTRYGLPVPAVRDVSFALAPGETVGLVGESGCGKSLTALSVMGLLPGAARMTAGRIGYDGRDLAALPERERRAVRGAGIAMIYQDPAAALNPLMRVGAQIREGLAGR